MRDLRIQADGSLRSNLDATATATGLVIVESDPPTVKLVPDDVREEPPRRRPLPICR